MPRPLKRSVRSRFRGMIIPVCSIAITGYFAYHVFYGDNGIISWTQLEAQSVALKEDRDAVKADRLALQRKVQLLRPESIDPDLLDERVRDMLNFANPNDVVLFPSDGG